MSSFAARTILKRGSAAMRGSSSPSSIPSNGRGRGQILRLSQFVKSHDKGTFLIDTLTLVRMLEAQGLPSKNADAIASAITEVLDESLENMVQLYASKEQMKKSEINRYASLSKLRSELQSSLISHRSLIQSEVEKVRADMEKRGTETLNSEKWSKLRCDSQKLWSEIIDESVKIRDELSDEMRENLSLALEEIEMARAQLAFTKTPSRHIRCWYPGLHVCWRAWAYAPS